MPALNARNCWAGFRRRHAKTGPRFFVCAKPKETGGELPRTLRCEINDWQQGMIHRMVHSPTRSLRHGFPTWMCLPRARHGCFSLEPDMEVSQSVPRRGDSPRAPFFVGLGRQARSTKCNPERFEKRALFSRLIPLSSRYRWMPESLDARLEASWHSLALRLTRGRLYFPSHASPSRPQAASLL